MKKLFICLFAFCLLAFCGKAQEAGAEIPPEQLADSSLIQPQVIDIFTQLSTPNSQGCTLSLHQPASVQAAIAQYKTRNSSKKTSGFRVRIFFDNNQTARQRANETESNFHALYPETPAYLTYENLYFKVTVGDFRNRSDAMRFLSFIAPNYPNAFIIKENINYPSL